MTVELELVEDASDMVAALKLRLPTAVGHAGIFFKMVDDHWGPQASISYPRHCMPVLNET